MAFYHVNQCLCPIGNCFCGLSRDIDLAIIYNPKKDEIYLWDVTGSAMRVDHLCEQWEYVSLGMLIERIYG